MLCDAHLVDSYVTDFRSLISEKTSAGSSSSCSIALGISKTGFLEITSTERLFGIDFTHVVDIDNVTTTSYYNSMMCFWHIYNPYHDGSVEISFSNFNVSSVVTNIVFRENTRLIFPCCMRSHLVFWLVLRTVFVKNSIVKIGCHPTVLKNSDRICRSLT